MSILFAYLKKNIYFCTKYINNRIMAMMKKLKAERNDRLFAEFKEMTANGDTKGVVFKLALKYHLCTQQVYRIIWKLDKKGSNYEN